MIAAFKVLGVVLAWPAVNDAIQFGFYMHSGIDPEVAHLFESGDKSVKYSWEGGDFYSHAFCYSRK